MNFDPIIKLDLHVHSSCSDGLLSPEELVDFAVNHGLDGISVTDHDSVSGISEAICQGSKYSNFYVIPGIEFGCIYENEDVHILGYLIDYKNTLLNDVIRKLRFSRQDRATMIIKKLEDLDIYITIDDVKKHSKDDNIGRPHIARALIEKSYVNSIEEGFEKYLDRGKPAYIERFQLSIVETIDLIHSIGGISVLAHPVLLKNKHIIDYCIEQGIQGLECIHSKHSAEDEKIYKEIASQNNLIVTGGSDFHGDKPLLGKYYISLEDIPVMKARILNE